MIGLMCMKELMLRKTDGLRECIICNYWYFLGIIFRFDSKLCNSCYGIMQKAMGFNDVAMFSVKGNNYRIPFWYVSKDEAINLLKKADFTEKMWNIIEHKNLLSHIKTGKEIIRFGKIEIEKVKFHRYEKDQFLVKNNCEYVIGNSN